jgi:tRNA threonylcarbamoyladenosine modification (KEOPS) complex  Pcc1 subunit
MEASLPFHSRIVLQFQSPEQAEIVRKVLSVDEELQPQRLTISFSTSQDHMSDEHQANPQLIM